MTDFVAKMMRRLQDMVRDLEQHNRRGRFEAGKAGRSRATAA